MKRQKDMEAVARAYVEESAARLQRERAEDAEARPPAFRDKKATELLREELADAGLDLKRLDKIGAKQTKLRKAYAEKSRLSALARSAEIARRLAARTPVIAPPAEDPAEYILLDRPTFIRSFVDGGTMLESDIVALDSWARYRFESGRIYPWQTPTGRLSFFTLWRNERSRAVVVSPGARLVVNANLAGDTGFKGIGAWVGSEDTARATIRVRTTVHPLWDPNLATIVADREIGGISVSGGFWGDYEDKGIAFNEHVAASAMSVVRGGTILIEVALMTECNGSFGSITLDAEAGSHRVSMPHIILTIT